MRKLFFIFFLKLNEILEERPLFLFIILVNKLILKMMMIIHLD